MIFFKKTNLNNPIVVSPDIGGVVRARAIAKLLNDADMAIIDKRRPKSKRFSSNAYHWRCGWS